MKSDLKMNDGRNNTGDSSSLLKQAFLALQEMEAKLDAAERRNTEPVAIVGMGCRLPGGVVDGETFWNLLCEGRDAISLVPPERWDRDAYYDPDPDAPGKMVTRSGGFLDRFDGFDARFFEIAPREAASMDPQQQLALEVVWETLENAGYAPAGLEGSRTGVFLGIASNDYSQLNLAADDPELLNAHYASGVAHSIASGRISYLLGLEGPSVSLDTACSSSLVAVHLACQSLRAGDCTVALAGGVNLMLAPETTALLSRVRMLSPDGRCKAFDEAADGFVRGEGCGFVALKTLSQAQADGDRILAVIRGTAVNQDGASSSLTAPNGPSQVKLMRQALANGGVPAAEVSYIEAHGTGTALGDPIELQALGTVYGAVRPAGKSLMVGSLKTNVGHLEAAAGIAGLLKAVLAIQHGQIPPHLHLHRPTPYVRWEDLRLTVPGKLTEWEAGADASSNPRIAAVSSFGFSGTNAHVVVAETPPTNVVRRETGWSEQILAISARSKTALKQLAARYREYLQAHPDTDLRDFCFTANTGRTHFGYRACLLAPDVAAMEQELAKFEPADRAVSSETRRIGFLFTGQGSQHSGMGRELYESSPVFREAIERVASAWKQETGESLIEVLYPAEATATIMEQARYAQPALFAFDYALAGLWRSWGIEPGVLLGHSLGEYVAAAIAGVFSMEDGLRMVCARARLMDTLTTPGAMRAVSAPVDRVRAEIAGLEKEIGIGVINGPQSVVLSGEVETVNRIAAKLEAEGVRTRALQVTHAFHSPLLEPILEEFEQCARRVKYHSPRIRIISNLTGEAARADEIAKPEYWRKHMRGTVLFHAGLQSALATGCATFLEIGPQPHLITLSKATNSGPGLLWLPSARKGRNAWIDILSAVQALYQQGVEIDWRALHGTSGRPIALPTYPFERQRYWFPKKAVGAHRLHTAPSAPGYPLLGSRLYSPLAEIQYQSRIDPDHPAYLGEHVVAGQRVLPAAGYLEMALSAGAAENTGLAAIKSIAFLRPCVFDSPRTLQCVLRDEDGARSFAIYSSSAISEDGEKDWTLHATGEISTEADSTLQKQISRMDIEEIRKRCVEESNASAFYRPFDENGIDFGPNFRPVFRVFRGSDEALVEFEFSGGIKADAERYRTHLHPAMLDGCIQSVIALLDSDSRVYMPAALDSLQITGDPRNLAMAHAQVRESNRRGNGDSLTADFVGMDAAGTILISAKGLVLRPLRLDAGIKTEPFSTSFYEVEWMAVQPESGSDLAIRGTCLLSGHGSIVHELSQRLEKDGIPCATVQLDESDGTDDSYEQAIASLGSPPVSDCIYIAPRMNESADPGSADRSVRLEENSLRECLRISQALLRTNFEQTPRLWIVTSGAQGPNLSNIHQSSLWGFGRSTAAEHSEMRVVRIDLDPARDASPEELLRCIRAAGTEEEIARRGKEIYVPRLRRIQPEMVTAKNESASNLRLELIEPGTLEGIEIRPAGRQDPGPDEVEIRVAAAGLNFRDVLNVLGMYKGKSGPLGGECAGTVVRVGPGVESLQPGDEVVALGQGCFAEFVTTGAKLVWPKPAKLSFEAAVTIPVAFLTAWYALKSLASIQPGERVLIHAGAGGVGMAAIQVAQQAGATVFATAGSPEKRAFLASIGVDHVMDSRSLDFAQEIRSITNGHGVDVVLNSLTGAFIDAGIELLSLGGRFIEMGVADIRSAESVAQIRPDIMYQAFNLAPALAAGDSFIRDILTAVFEQLQAGLLHPLPREVFTLEKARDAFRYMAQARHVGRVILCPAQKGSAGIRKDGAYLVTGGLSGIGFEVAAWLAERGAAQVIVMGRSAANADAVDVFKKMRDGGTIVSVCRGDVAREADIQTALDQARSFAVRGVFHCAGVLDDGALVQQSWDRFRRVLAPKLEGARNLDRLTADLPLDHFVLFSSVASVLGSPGQTNYAAANASLDALAHDRRSRGLPGLSINWGVWSETGFAARNGIIDRGSKIGLRGISTADGLRALEVLLAGSRAQVMFASVDWKAYFLSGSAGVARPLLSDLRETGVRPARSDGLRADASSQKKQSWLPQLETAAPAMRPEMMMQLLEARVQTTLGISAAQEIDPDQPLQELGLDSLLSIELRNSLGTCLNRSLPATLLFNYPTLNALAGFILRDVLVHLQIDSDGDTRKKDKGYEVDASPAALVEDIEALSDEEVDRLLSTRAAGVVR